MIQIVPREQLFVHFKYLIEIVPMKQAFVSWLVVSETILNKSDARIY